MTECSYCGCDVTDHDPVYVREGDPDAPVAGRYCNYACLTAHVEAAGLAADATCNWEPT